jgi:type I restriction enzyme, S subunit
MSETVQIPKGWELKKLSDVCNVDTGYAFKSSIFQTHGIPLIRIGNIQDDEVTFKKNTVFLDRKLVKKHQKFLIEKNQILIALSGATTGKSAIYHKDETAFLNQRVGRIKFFKDNPNLQKYVYYFIKKIGFEVLNKSYGGAQPNISPTLIGNFDIMIPLDDQILNKIVQKLDDILGQLDEKKKEIFSIVEQNKQRIAFFEKNWLLYIIDREILHHPEKNQWPQVNLKDIGEIVTGNTPITSKPEYYGKEYCFYKPGDLKQTFVSDSTNHLSKLGLDKARFLPKNSILVVCIGASIGKTSMIEKEGASNQQITSIISNYEKISPMFLFYFIKSKKFQEQINSSSTGVAKGWPIINKTNFGNLKIMLPDTLTQNNIVQNIKSAEQKFQSQKIQFENIKQNYEKTIKYVNNLQSSILDVAFSGKLIQ